MKRLFTLFVIVCALVGNAWGGIVYFQNTSVEYRKTVSPVEEPETQNGHKYVKQDVWYLDHDGDTPVNLGRLQNDKDEYLQDVDFVWAVDVTGDITIPEGYYLPGASNGHYELKQGTGYGSNIYFDCPNNGKGTITVTATNPDYYGQVYICSYTIYYHTDVNSQKWDFYTKKIISGRMSEKSNIGTDWTKATEEGFNTPYNGSNEDSANALYWLNSSGSSFSGYSTFGGTSASSLLFKCTGNQQIGICDESIIEKPNAYRCIALKAGASFRIPKEIYSGWGTDHPRIRIKMGRYGSASSTDLSAHLTIDNGLDALGTKIALTYNIGGSYWWGDKGDNNHRGEYHFRIDDKNNDFTITITEGQWIMLYSIEVYDSDDLATENSILGDKYQLLNIDGTIGNPGVQSSYWLHYRGKGEKTRLTTDNSIKTSGSVTLDCDNENNGAGSFDKLSGVTSHTYTSKIGDFGTFYIILRCYEQSGTYCTDYASRRQSVGYRKNQSYPYTWDFKDVKGSITGNDNTWREGHYKDTNRNLWNVENSAQYGLRVAQDGGHNVLFCSGSQLWFGLNMIAETAGLSFTSVNSDKTYNGVLSVSTNGLKFDQINREWWGWRVTVPSVPANAAVYIRAKNAGSNDGMRHVKYYIGSGVNNKTAMTEFAASAAPANKLQVSGTTDEYIYAIYNNSGSTNDITFFFNEVEVQKIAVSTDKKEFNAKGWTTESRDHDIDPSLTAEMNGRGIKTYAVTEMKYDKKKVVMTDISNVGLMHAATDESKYACILRNTEDAELSVVNGGFYLFVPDMHDEQGENTGDGYRLKNYAPSMESSIMKAKVSYAYPANYPNYGDNASGTPIPAKSDDGTITNFAFTYQYCQLNSSGEAYGTLQEGPQAFYRIATNGGYSKGNQGYLPLLTSEVTKNTAITSGTRGYELSFGDDEEGGETTDIETIVNGNDLTGTTHRTYYSLSGQQLNGKPAKGGIYICNGKKIVIK